MVTDVEQIQRQRRAERLVALSLLAKKYISAVVIQRTYRKRMILRLAQDHLSSVIIIQVFIFFRYSLWIFL